MNQLSKLGKGLQALIPPKERAMEVDYPKISQPLRDKKESIFNIEATKIRPNPFQPRDGMEVYALKDLADSIKQHGILQPLIVTKVVRDTSRGQEVEYELVSGHRRLEAAKLAGLPTVPVIVRDTTEQQKLELALIENVQRADLNPIEKARAFKRLHDEFSLTHEEVAQKIGKSRELVANSIRLLNLPDIIQQGMAQGKITEGHGRAIAAIKNPVAAKVLYDEVLQNNLSVRQVEQRAREVYVQAHQRRVVFDPEIRRLAQKLEMYFGRKVKVKKSGLGGKVIINFENKDDLSQFVSKIFIE